MSVNQVILNGRVLKPIDLQDTRMGKVFCSFPLAVPRNYKEEGTTWAKNDVFNIRVWTSTAELMSRLVSKGDWITVVGRLQQDKYVKNGEVRTAVSVVVESFECIRAAGDSMATVFKEGGRRVTNQDRGQSTWDDMGEDMPSVEGVNW